jgi:hypothetical protein
LVGAALGTILVLPLSLLQAGCPRCTDDYSFSRIYSLKGFQGRACDVEFVGPAGRVRYEAPAPALRGSAADSEDGGKCVEQGIQIQCIQLDGPTTISGKYLCFRQACSIALSFSPDDSHRLTDFLGTSSFDTIVSCDGTIATRETIPLPQQSCPQ